MRGRLRLLFMSLMAVGLGWIYLMNYVRLGKTPADYTLSVTLVNWGGAILVGLLLDALAGFYLRPFFRFLERMKASHELPPAETQFAAKRAMYFPERASTLLLGISAVLILINRVVQHRGRLWELLLSPDHRPDLLSSMVRDMVLTLLLALLLFTLSRRVLNPGVAALALREVPAGRRFPLGLRQALVVIVMGLFNLAVMVSTPENVPAYRLMWIYLPPVLLTALVAYLVATDSGRDLDALAGQLRMLSAGVRPNLFRRFAVTERDEVGELVSSINALQNRVEREVRELERDMEAASSIQQGMLPRDIRLPPGWQLAARLLPAREVGGDFYDLIDLGEGRFGLALGDAAGKGLPAALLMASTVSLLRSHAPLHDSPARVLSAVNRLLCASLPPMSFVTAVFAIVDTVTREVRVASAGHFPPLIGGREMPVVSALPLGIEPDVEYEERVWPLASGESIVIYSDGFIEAADPGSPLQDSRWIEVLREPGGGAEAVVSQLMESHMTNAGQGSLRDDVTLLMVTSPAVLQFELPSREGAELEAHARTADFAREHGPAGRSDDVASAVGEACLNALSHGNRFQAEIPIRVRLSAGAGWLEATVADSGPVFTPPDHPPDLAAQMRGDEPICGWGLHLIGALADEVYIEPLSAGKQVRMRFGGRADV